ncbi:MAG: hypothetical protein BGP25_05470 [Lysobacterales bacterium 63-13]|nr:MAG: hypothetical protein BGP25_05470 [Xanthomonadales bacterium 63-13]
MQDIHADEQLTTVAKRVAKQQVIEGLEDAFPDCTTTTHFRNVGFKEASTYQDRACQRLATPPTCTHSRDVTMVPTSGTYESDETVQSNVSFSINVRDYMPGFVGGTVSANLSWSGTVEGVSITQPPTAQNAYSLEISIVYDSSGCDPAVGGCPEQTAHITIALEAAIVAGGEIASSPPDCLDGDDGFCAATWECLESGPRVVNGVLIDESSAPFLPRLYSGEPPSQLCWLAQASYRCTYPVGEVCGEGAGSGGVMCESVTDASVQPSSCASLETDPLCGKVRTQCASNAVGPGAFCYVEVDSYRCKTQANAPVLSQFDEFTCTTPIRCMGSDCLKFDDNDPATTAPRLTHQEQLGLLQHALADFDPACTGVPCRHFVGETLKCHRATGGNLSFCTEENSVESKFLYLRWFDIQTRRAAAIAMEQADDGRDVGNWAQLQQSSNWNLGTLQASYLTSIKEGIRSNGESPRRITVEAPSTQEQFEDMLGQKPELINLAKVYGQFVRTVELPTSGWDGSAEEFELHKKRGLHQCLHVGDFCQAGGGSACPSIVESYCCFSTALSKSVHEHLGTDFGDARAPTCSAGTDVPLQQILADTSFVASEWTAMQTLAGRQPNFDTMDSMSGDENLTGHGSTIRLSDQERDSLVTRTEAMLSSLNGQGIHAAVEADARTQIPAAVRDPIGPGTVSFSPAIYFGDGSRGIVASLLRNGKQGAVSASFMVTSPAGSNGVVFPSSGRVSWADGEDGSKQILLKVDGDRVTSTEQTFHIVVGSTSGGLSLGDRPSASIILKSRHQP